MYTDDHQIYVMGKKHDVVVQSIKTLGEQALSGYKNNSQPSDISQPTQKSFSWYSLLTINPRNVDTDNVKQDISVDGHEIERMGEIKLLGVQIDEKLNFTSHSFISELCTKASQKEMHPIGESSSGFRSER